MLFTMRVDAEAIGAPVFERVDDALRANRPDVNDLPIEEKRRLIREEMQRKRRGGGVGR